MKSIKLRKPVDISPFDLDTDKDDISIFRMKWRIQDLVLDHILEW